MTTPNLLAPQKVEAASGHRTALGLLIVVALGASAAMLLSLLARADAPFDAGPVPPPPVVPLEPAATVPDAAAVFAGHDGTVEPQPPSF